VLDADRNVVCLAAGDPATVLEHCAAICARVYGVAIRDRFDVVVASCGGHPKDICLYQAQKGLNLASRASKPGGHILLLAAAPQGVGDDVFFRYVSQFASPEEVVRDFTSNGFRIGAHKACLFARTLLNHDVAVFSDVEPDVLRRCHLRPATPAAVIDEWLSAVEATPTVAIVPDANTTYFHDG
jgi:nickel-dependent lactate racemase